MWVWVCGWVLGVVGVRSVGCECGFVGDVGKNRVWV